MRILGRVLVVLGLLVGASGAALVAFDYAKPADSARILLELEQQRSGLHEARAEIAGFKVAFLEGGAGEPLVLLHGFGADKNNFTRVARYLTPRYHVVIPDLPGFGDSSRPEGATYSIADQVERLRALLGVMHLRRVHLGGSSMGGWIATAWAAKYPDEVASLWLLDAAGTKAGFESELQQVYAKTGENRLLAKTPADFDGIAAFVMSRPPFLPHSIRTVLAERAAADYRLHQRIFEGLVKEPALDDYARGLAAPALIVWGEQDRALGAGGAEALKALIPGATIVRMPGIGHLPMIEAVAQSAADYLSFRQQLR